LIQRTKTTKSRHYGNLRSALNENYTPPKWQEKRNNFKKFTSQDTYSVHNKTRPWLYEKSYNQHKDNKEFKYNINKYKYQNNNQYYNNYINNISI
jgi:hypothetical protein